MDGVDDSFPFRRSHEWAWENKLLQVVFFCCARVLICFRSSPVIDCFPPHLLKIQVAAVQEVPSILEDVAGRTLVGIPEDTMCPELPFPHVHSVHCHVRVCLHPSLAAGAYAHLSLFHSKCVAHFTQIFPIHPLASQDVPKDPNWKKKPMQNKQHLANEHLRARFYTKHISLEVYLASSDVLGKKY